MNRYRLALTLLLVILGGVPGCGDAERDSDGATPRGSFREDPAFTEARNAMVDRLAEMIRGQRVLDALRRVPRHEFVPEHLRARAYDIRNPLPIGENQTISSPEIVAIMTQALRLEGDERVLEIGTGSGYQAAVLGELAAEVYSIEIRKRLADSARARLERLKREGALSYRKIDVIEGNGYHGYQPNPDHYYDAIIVTAAPPRVPVTLMQQLKPDGGRMVVPIGDFYQKLQIIERRADEAEPFVETIQTVRFVPMVDDPGDGR